MMRRSLDVILKNAQTGRAISPAGIVNGAVDLLNTPVKKLVKPGPDEEEAAWAVDFARFAGLEDSSPPYGEALMAMRRQAIRGYLNSDLYLYLAAMVLGGDKEVRKWMHISIEDAMTEAGLERDFDIWLKEDVRVWEKLHGKAPKIANLMRICFDAFASDCNEDARVFPPGEQEIFLFPECRVTDPFVRHEEDAGINYFGAGKRDLFTDNYTRLVCKWVWLLMEQAPLAILNKKYKK